MDKKNGGVIGDVQIDLINNGLPFWTEIPKSAVIMSIEMNVDADVLRTHGIRDFVVVPGNPDGAGLLVSNKPKVLIEWYKRFKPLSDEELSEKYGKTEKQKS